MKKKKTSPKKILQLDQTEGYMNLIKNLKLIPKTEWDKNVSVPLNHFFSLLLYSGRYAFGRSSAAFTEVIDYVKTYAHHLPNHQLETILKDVKEALKSRRTSVEFHLYYIEELQKLEAWLEKRISSTQ